MAYITVQDMRREGVSDSVFPTAFVQERITLAERAVELMTGCFFDARSKAVKLDGRGHDLLWLPFPPTSTSAITSVTIDGDAVDTDDYEVLMPEFPDGRFNPKLRHLVGTWPKGKSNIIANGEFGFVESDGSVPPFIKDLCIRIAVWNMPQVGDLDKQRQDRIVEESLKDYRYKLADPSLLAKGMFGDPKIDNVIALFRRPAMGVTR